MQSRLMHLETVIAQQRSGFYSLGKALKEIRDRRLYHEVLYDSFEAYLRHRWEMSRSHGYRLIEAARVIDNLSPIGDILPENEAQVRALAPVKASEQRKVWRDFLATDMQLNARNILRFVRGCINASQSPTPDLSEVISSPYKQAVMAMLEQIRLAKQDAWQCTSQQAALLWNRVMKDQIVSKL